MSRDHLRPWKAARRWLAGMLAMLSLMPGLAAAQDLPSAEFRVTDQVVTPPLEPFTATLVEFGNGGRFFSGGSFEPVIFRTQFQAIVDDPDRIILPPHVISGFDTWRDGAFDGAEIEVLRIENGKFVSVRTDHVAQGGFKASGWWPLMKQAVMAPWRTDFLYTWQPFNDAQRPYYFTVRAVDDQGRLSPPAAAFSIQRPAVVKAKPEKVDKRNISPDPEGAEADLPAPQGLTGRVTTSGGLVLSWDPVPGAAGYIPYVSDYPPEQQHGYEIDLAGQGAPIRAGDMILLRAKMQNPDPRRLLSNRVQGAGQYSGIFLRMPGSLPDMPDRARWEFRAHDPKTPVTDPGESYLHFDLSGKGEAKLGGYMISGTGQDFYPVLDPDKTYRLDVWLRGDRGSRAMLEFPERSKKPLASFDIGPEWHRYQIDFKGPPQFSGTQAQRIFLHLTGHGAIDVDNLRLYRADAPYLAFLPEEKQALQDAGMGALRTHGFIKTGVGTYDLTQLTNPAGVTRRPWGNTLPQTLQNFADVGAAPWLQIEPHLSAAEWLGLAEYLAAPFDPAVDDPAKLPWAAKRVAQGQRAPWTDRFDRIYFEIGNETWNSLFLPWTFRSMPEAAAWGLKTYTPGQVYGLYQEYVLQILRQSPWWDRLEPKLRPVLGGWAWQTYGEEAARLSPSSRYLTVAAYNGGWDAGEDGVTETSKDYASVMAYGVQVQGSNAQHMAEQAQEIGAAHGLDLESGTYEGGPGYVMNGLNKAKVSAEQKQEQERVMKSAAAGAATLDSFLIRARNGDRIQNFFTFGQGAFWTSHAPWYRGGQAWPSWDWLALFNRIGLGEMLDVQTLAVPTRDLPERGRRKAMDAAPMVAVYATRAGERMVVTVISRLVPGVPGVAAEGHARVQIALPFDHAQRLTRHRVTADYRQNNLEGRNVQIVAEKIDPPAGKADLVIEDMPPASAQIYVFEGIGRD